MSNPLIMNGATRVKEKEKGFLYRLFPWSIWIFLAGCNTVLLIPDQVIQLTGGRLKWWRFLNGKQVFPSFVERE